MHGYRFFEEYRDEGRKDSLNSVVAIDVGRGPFVQEGGVCYRAVCTDREKNEVGQRGVRMVLFNAEYLGTHCRRVSEERARAIQPKLFEYLDTIA